MKITKQIIETFEDAGGYNNLKNIQPFYNKKWFGEEEIKQKTNKVFNTWSLGSIDKELLKKELLEELFKENE